jgi:ribosomal protein S18
LAVGILGLKIAASKEREREREKRVKKSKKICSEYSILNTQYSILKTYVTSQIHLKKSKHKNQTSNITIDPNEIYARGLEVRKRF